MGKRSKKKRGKTSKQSTNKRKSLRTQDSRTSPRLKEFDVGDCVAVKEGTLDPDYGDDISGWQGRISELPESDDPDPLVRVEWDSITVDSMPRSVIENSERDGLDWKCMDLYATDLESAEPRDKAEDVGKAVKVISEKYNLEDLDELEPFEDEDYLDEHSKRVMGILDISDEEDMVVNDENLERYFHYFSGHIESGCLVTGIEDFHWEEFYVFGPGDEEEYEALKKTRPSFTDEYRILGFEDYDRDYGIFVKVRRVSDRRQFVLPLADLKAVDEDSPDFRILDDYAVWFVNCR